MLVREPYGLQIKIRDSQKGHTPCNHPNFTAEFGTNLNSAHIARFGIKLDSAIIGKDGTKEGLDFQLPLSPPLLQW